MDTSLPHESETRTTDDGLVLERHAEGWRILRYEGGADELRIPEALDGVPLYFIGTHAFEDCTSLRSLYIPDSVSYISTFAFQGCSGLRELRISESLDTLNLGSFWGCSSLVQVQLPAHLKSIGDGAFRNCTSLRSIEIPFGVEVVGDSAFRSCSSLESVDIPASVVKLARSAFRDCDNLCIVALASSVSYLGPRTFEGCPKLSSIRIVGESPERTAAAFLNTQTMYLVADYLVQFRLLPLSEATRLLMGKDERLKLLGARVLVTYPEELGKVASKFSLIRALAEAGRTLELRVLEDVAGYFTKANLIRAIEAASTHGQIETVAYLMDRKAALDGSNAAYQSGGASAQSSLEALEL